MERNGFFHCLYPQKTLVASANVHNINVVASQVLHMIVAQAEQIVDAAHATTGSVGSHALRQGTVVGVDVGTLTRR